MESYNCPIIDAFGRYLRKVTAAEASNWGTAKLELEV